MRVHHLNCGSMRPFGGKIIDGRPGMLRSAAMVCHCLLVETGDGLVLVDTGIGMTDIDPATRTLGREFQALTRPLLDPEETAVRQVIRLGYDPADVRHIVLTHLDLDHAGGLPDFPSATVHVMSDELDAARSPATVKERQRYRSAHWAHRPDWRGHATPDGEPWFGFGAVRELVDGEPGILLIPLAGHSRGHAGVAVHTGSGWLLHAGDAYFHHGETDPAGPRGTPGLTLFQTIVQQNKAARLGNQRRLRELVRQHAGEVTVFSAHCATEFTAHATSPA